jgi:hypothetical protein
MAGIINASINLSDIPKDKIIDGKKGKYLNITITINDEVDSFGNHGPIIVSQSKEERDSKEDKTYLGNVKVVWSNGVLPEPVKTQSKHDSIEPKKRLVADGDLPF